MSGRSLFCILFLVHTFPASSAKKGGAGWHMRSLAICWRQQLVCRKSNREEEPSYITYFRTLNFDNSTSWLAVLTRGCAECKKQPPVVSSLFPAAAGAPHYTDVCLSVFVGRKHTRVCAKYRQKWLLLWRKARRKFAWNSCLEFNKLVLLARKFFRTHITGANLAANKLLGAPRSRTFWRFEFTRATLCGKVSLLSAQFFTSAEMRAL